ncbi:MAG: hypothetical protein ABJL44_14085 [Algibacter sp.]
MKKIRLHSAGIDVGVKKLFVSIENQPVKSFDTFTEDLELLSTLFKSHNIEIVAMERLREYIG